MSFGKAPGPTGASASMFKAWPDAVHDQVLLWINEIWQSRNVPSWWYLGHLKPIPKTGEISLDNIRPLGLYEISRKLLTAIIIKRIYMAWERIGCLNPNQHAFRRGKSTTQAILRVLNVSEDVAEHGTPLWQILWDFKRAFDSIQFNFTKLALARLGVPINIIEFLTDMMEQNEMAVASPHHMAQHDLNKENECSGLKFHQERGTGQGDPPSPIIWIAIFDILLDMLAEQGKDGAFYAHGPATQVYPATDVAYADDLVTLSSSHAAQQKKVDAVCTFCACTGMQIAYVKVRTFAINCEKYAPNIVLRDNAWQPIIMKPNTDSIDMKYLGFLSHHVDGDMSAMEYVINYLREASVHIIHCQATRKAKLAVFKMQVVPKVMYMAAKACWTIEQYRELDKYAAPILKHIGRHMNSSPNSMLFFPKDLCGTGINALSDTAQTRKWGELTTSLQSSGEDQLAAYGLLERALRQTAQQTIPSQHRVIGNKHTQHLKGYAGSLIQWGHEIGMSLNCTAIFEDAPANAPILPLLHEEDEKVLRLLQRYDITVQGELIRTCNDGTYRWNTDNMTSQVKSALGDQSISFPTNKGLILNQGQMMSIKGRTVEVIGYDRMADEVICYEWHELAQKPKLLIRHTQHNLAIKKFPRNFFDEEWAVKIICQISRSAIVPERYSVCKLYSSFTTSTPTTGILRSWEIPAIIQEFAKQVQCSAEQCGHYYALYSDGSSKTSTIIEADILCSAKELSKKNKTSAALVAIANTTNWRNYECWVLLLDTSDASLKSFDAELTALTVASLVQGIDPTIEVFSDCESAIATVEQACEHKDKSSGKSQNKILTEALRRTGHCPNIRWVRSHPERRKPDKSSWSNQDWGIFLADMLAEGDFSIISTLNGGVYRTPLTTIMQELLIPGTWYWSKHHENVPTTQSLVQLHSQKRVANYLHQRDKYRKDADTTAEARWEGTSLALASRCWKKYAKTFVQQNIALRHILDKYWNGRNRAKGLRGPAKEEALRCTVCGGADSQRHLLLECQHEDLDDIRQQAWDNLSIEMMNLQEDMLLERKRQHSVAQFIYEQAFNNSYPDFDRLWLGTWNCDVLKDAIAYTFQRTNLMSELEHEDLENVHLIMIRLTNHLTKATMQLQKVQSRIIKQLEAEKNHDENPRKRRKTSSLIASADEPQDMEICVPYILPDKQSRKKHNKRKRVCKAVKTAKRPYKKKLRESSRKRCQIIPKVRESELQVSDMEIVTHNGTSDPRGETQDTDYDRD